MTAPTMTRVAEQAYGRLGAALTSPDPEHGWALARLLSVLVDPVDDAHALVRDGWAGVLDPAATPEVWLRWLAQAAGVTIPEGTDLETARAMVTHPVGWLAGTPQALRTAVAGTLTGSKTVWIEEHVERDPFKVTVTVFRDETPSVERTTQAALGAVEAGIKVTVQVQDGWTFADLAASGLTFGELARIRCRDIKRVVPGTPLEKVKELMH